MTTAEIDRKHMMRAVALANECRPNNPERIPQVGAVFAVGEVVIGSGSRGSGKQGDDEHAEFNALAKVAEKSQLPQATLYTTLEPCTKDVRSKQHLACTELIVRHQLKKVFVGTLDPNQGVCGKGILTLQEHKIEVELFPPDLAQQIRILMDPFIAAQRVLGARILDPQPNQEILLLPQEDGTRFGKCELVFECANDPDENVLIVKERDGVWFPAGEGKICPKDGDRTWAAELHWRTAGNATIHVVKMTTAAGAALIAYNRKVGRESSERQRQLSARLAVNLNNQVFDGLPAAHPSIDGMLPKGVESQASVPVRLVERD